MSALFMTEATRLRLREEAAQAAALAIIARSNGHTENAATYVKRAADLQELANRPQPSFPEFAAALA